MRCTQPAEVWLATARRTLASMVEEVGLRMVGATRVTSTSLIDFPPHRAGPLTQHSTSECAPRPSRAYIGADLTIERASGRVVWTGGYGAPNAPRTCIPAFLHHSFLALGP